MTRTPTPDDVARFDAVLFDMDGTLVDSEPIWFAVMQEVAARFGAPLPDDAHARLRGVDRDASMALLRAQYGLEVDPPAFWGAVMDRLVDAVAAVPAMPGAAAWVEALAAAGRPRAVVSNSPRAMIEASLAPHAWGAHVTVRLGADEVPRPKPAPDGYRLAATRLGVAAERCLVLEDSEAGVLAARAAGAAALLITRGETPSRAARDAATWEVASLDEVTPAFPRSG